MEQLTIHVLLGFHVMEQVAQHTQVYSFMVSTRRWTCSHKRNLQYNKKHKSHYQPCLRKPLPAMPFKTLRILFPHSVPESSSSVPVFSATQRLRHCWWRRPLSPHKTLAVSLPLCKRMPQTPTNFWICSILQVLPSKRISLTSPLCAANFTPLLLSSSAVEEWCESLFFLLNLLSLTWSVEWKELKVFSYTNPKRCESNLNAASANNCEP